jgi:hypothetical protein
MEHKVHICNKILVGTIQGNFQQVCTNFLVLLLIHLYAFKKVCDSIDPRNMPQIFLHAHHNAHNELINPGQFIPVYIIELCHEALMIFVNPSSLFSSSNKITLHTYACFSKLFAFLTQQNHSPYTCMFL